MRLVLAAALLAFALPAAAQTPPAPGAPPSGRPPASPAVMAARRAVHQACAADVARLCPNPADPRGAFVQCIRAHRPDVSAPCQGALANLQTARSAG